jgi:hypothetical protein
MWRIQSIDAPLLSLIQALARFKIKLGLDMNIVTHIESAREREACAALAAHYRQIGSGAIRAAVLAVTRQREILAGASAAAKQAA